MWWFAMTFHGVEILQITVRKLHDYNINHAMLKPLCAFAELAGRNETLELQGRFSLNPFGSMLLIANCASAEESVTHISMQNYQNT